MVCLKVSPYPKEGKIDRIGNFAKVTKILTKLNVLPVSIKDDFSDANFSFKVPVTKRNS